MYGAPRGPMTPSPSPPAGARGPASSPWVWLVVVGAVGLVTCGGTLGLCAYKAGATSDHPSGVTMGSQVPDKTLALLRSKGVLVDGEKLVAYYDATLSLDATELALVTTERVVTTKDKKVAAVRLDRITSASHHTESLIGDVIDIADEDGTRLRIEIANLNGGESFVSALSDTLATKRPNVVVKRLGKR